MLLTGIIFIALSIGLNLYVKSETGKYESRVLNEEQKGRMMDFSNRFGSIGIILAIVGIVFIVLSFI